MTDKKIPSVLAFEDRFPLTEKKLESSFSENQIADLSHSAVDCLKAIISLEQMSNEIPDPDAKGTTAELHRIEQKIDFVTELLAYVIQAQQNIPEKQTIKMSSESIFWSSELSLSPGDNCLLSIYLSQKYPHPFELPVVIKDSSSDKVSEQQTEAKILLTDEDVIDDLTRLVFLFHRRQIARNRSQS